MEGSIHEKAALVSLAYFIGGLTMFIAFGINISPGLIETTVMPASVYSSQLRADSTPAKPPAEQSNGVSVTYLDGILKVTTMDGSQALSFNPEVTGMEVTPTFEKQGHHYTEPVWTMSGSGQYIYFCEQQSQANRNCTSFVYDVIRQVIYPVTFAGASSPVPIEMADSAIFDGDILLIGNLRSSSTASPWELNYR